ncbi:amino acid ABC transporter ATP-binding/permease protein [Sphingopyxis chilensis]
MIDELIHTARRGQRRAVALGMATAALAALAAVALLAVSGWFLTGAAVAGMAGAVAVKAFNYLVPSAAIRALAIVRTLSRYGERLFSHQAMLFSLADVRTHLFARLVATPASTALLHDRGDVAARLGEDVQTLEEALLRTTLVPSGIATLAGASALVLLAGIGPAVVLLVAAMGIAVGARTIGARSIAPALAAESAALGRLKQRYVGLASGGDDLVVYGLGSDVRAALADAETPLHAARAALARADAAIGIAHWLLTGAAVTGVIAVSPASPPRVALAALATAAAMEIIGALVRLDVQRWKSRGARSRLDAMFPEPSASREHPVQRDHAIEITIRGARHPLEPGARVALTGASGSGKTRLLEMFTGLRDDAPEPVAIGGVMASQLPLAVRRNLFALAAQDAPMIAGSVADNLALARPGIDRTAMADALSVACVDDVVAALPGGLDCWLGDDGARLSGGQRKRLSLARALLARRPWLLLDEPSEGLEAETEALLVARLDAWLERTGTGLILVSHRPALIALVDRRLLL